MVGASSVNHGPGVIVRAANLVLVSDRERVGAGAR